MSVSRLNEYTFVLNGVYVVTDGSPISHAYTALYDAERKRRVKDIIYYAENVKIFDAQHRTFLRTGHCPIDMSLVESLKIVLYHLDTFTTGFVEEGYFDLFYAPFRNTKALLVRNESGTWMDDPDPHSWDHYNPFLSARQRRAAISFAAELATKLNRGSIAYHEISH